MIFRKLLSNIKYYYLIGLSPVWRCYLLLRGANVKPGLVSIGRPNITKKLGSSIQIGASVTLCNSYKANPLATRRCHLATVSRTAKIILHDNVGISSSTICAATRIQIGKGTLIGAGTTIIDTDFHSRRPDGTWNSIATEGAKPVIIGENCFIGSKSMILKGVSIGDGAVVGAGSIVTKNVPPGAVVAGNPARIINGVGLNSIPKCV